MVTVGVREEGKILEANSSKVLVLFDSELRHHLRDLESDDKGNTGRYIGGK